MEKSNNLQKSNNLDKPVTLGLLLEYTDEFLIPRLSDVIDDKIKTANAGQESRIKSYMDDKLADYTSDIFRRLDKKYKKEKQFKEKVVELFKKHKIGTGEDISFLEGYIQAI
jgi:hypothetical protein